MKNASSFIAIVVQLLAHFTLGEPWGVVPILMSIVAAIGVLVISKPPFLEGKAVTNENPDRYVSRFGNSRKLSLTPSNSVIFQKLFDRQEWDLR